MTDYDPENQNQQTVRYDDTLYEAPPQVVQDAISNQVPEGCTKVFKLAWWQQFFDNSSADVAKRVLQSLIIFKGNFIEDTNINKPDLWYPFWIVITLVFATFFSQIVVTIIANKSADLNLNAIDLGVICGIIIGYTLVIPAILFFVCWCLDMTGMSYLVILDLITYSFTILVPIMIVYPVFTVFL